MPESGKHILETFNAALTNLQNDLLMMAGLVERNIRNAYKGLVTRDDDLCNVAIADDEEIDALEKQVDQDGIELLRRFQPVASDLRQVVTAMKVNSNLERIADQATNIAKKARKLNRNPILNEVNLIEPLFQDAMSMYKDALRAYTERDVELAMTIRQRDKKLDTLNVDANDRLTEAMAQCPSRITDYLNLLFIARHLERVGDHAKNIAEEVVYAVSAEDIRHTHPPL
jgi:phosphate transport system protein